MFASLSYAQEVDNLDSIEGISAAEEEQSIASEKAAEVKPQQRCYEQAKNRFQAQNFSVCGSGDTIYDNQTGLMWSRCTLGKHWNAQTQSCEGDASTHNWKESLREVSKLNASAYLSQQDWRLPNVKEMGSLVDLSCVSPAIDATAFPDTDNSEFWTSTVFEQYPGRAWYYNFEFGNDYPANKHYDKQMRLVRLGKGKGSFNLDNNSNSKTSMNGCTALPNVNYEAITPNVNAGYSFTPKNDSVSMIEPESELTPVTNNDTSSMEMTPMATTAVMEKSVEAPMSDMAAKQIIVFKPINDVELSSLITSEAAVATLINKNESQAIRIENGEYEINGDGFWTSSPGKVKNGDRVTVRHLSSKEYLGESISTVFINDAAVTFQSTTIRYVF